MYYTDITDAKINLSQLIEMVSNGEDVVIGKSRKPVARIIQYHEDIPPRKGGQWKGKIRISSDFDILPDEIMQSIAGNSK